LTPADAEALVLRLEVVAITAASGVLKLVASTAALIEEPAPGEVTASSLDRWQSTGGLGIMAFVLALLLAGVVVGIAATARVDELVAESQLAVVVPADLVLEAVARLGCQEALRGVGGVGTIFGQLFLMFLHRSVFAAG